MAKTRLNVAVVGSGPAGLAVANRLVQNNFNVTVFDSLKQFGGMTAYGIPEFRIPLKTVQTQINNAKKLGIKFENRKISSIIELINIEEFDLAVIAIGAGAGSKAGFINQDSLYVIDALEFLLNDKLNEIHMVKPAQRVGIIGGGNSAIDAARVAKRQGTEAVIIYRRTEDEMPALKSEILAAKDDLVEFEFLLSPKQLIETGQSKCRLICSVMKLGEADSSGRRKPVDSKKVREFLFDKVIVAVGQQNDLGWLQREGIKTNGNLILVDENCLTSVENVYACGDAITGAKTIGTAVMTAGKCASSIIKKYCQKE